MESSTPPPSTTERGNADGGGEAARAGEGAERLRVQAASPLRKAAEALLFNSFHAPPPVPPPPHPPGEESDAAHAASHPSPAVRRPVCEQSEPQRAALLPALCPLLSAAADKGRDVLSLLFPRAFSPPRTAADGDHAAVTVEAYVPTPNTAALPACCQSSYRALLLALLLPHLPLAAAPGTAHLPPSDSDSAAASAPSEECTECIPAAALVLSPTLHPERHAEVLFDCPGDGAAEWTENHPSDAEDDGAVYFVTLFERYLAMAEGSPQRTRTTHSHRITSHRPRPTQHSARKARSALSSRLHLSPCSCLQPCQICLGSAADSDVQGRVSGSPR